ncbi:ATP-binding protein [Geodermatophilus sp. YIM 151500]|uniref:sensor histidine kinase n=1 Tax=Geodermatophilus sp. YIM 151500 TaxID=2984531 RepID=UPI0021E48406|nr:ATP-binding protein [Geodermatophilus sp. YIM 151500]MCV2491804.1 ATP-binding protein [Geodermatophilus sp. YIM 151500]
MRTSAPSGARIRRLPISVRLGATFAVVFLVVLAAMCGLAWFGLGQSLREEIDRSLVTAAQALDRPGRSLVDLEDARVGGVELPEFETQMIAPDGRVVGGTDDDLDELPVLSPEQTTATRQDDALFADVLDEEGDAHRALAVPVDRPRGHVLVVMAELDSVQDAQSGLLQLAALLSPLACLLAGAAGWFIARKGLQPVARMTADAERISARDPFPRLAVPPSRDEVARLGTTLNRLLDRIEEARRREREFTADASHELRTPLSILRAELELARNRATDRQFVEALDSALEESDRLGQLVDDLLLLASTDAGKVRPRTLVDVAEVVDGLLPGFRTLAGRRGISLAKSGDAVVRADPRALSRAVANLLDNAVRHAPDGGTVELTVDQRPDGTAITVTDDGPGVPPEERSRLTQRFTQSDRAAARTGGAGLGLAIVASVAAAHGGRVEIADAPTGSGLAVTILLPTPAAGPPVRSGPSSGGEGPARV